MYSTNIIIDWVRGRSSIARPTFKALCRFAYLWKEWSCLGVCFGSIYVFVAVRWTLVSALWALLRCVAGAASRVFFIPSNEAEPWTSLQSWGTVFLHLTRFHSSIHVCYANYRYPGFEMCRYLFSHQQHEFRVLHNLPTNTHCIWIFLHNNYDYHPS